MCTRQDSGLAWRPGGRSNCLDTWAGTCTRRAVLDYFLQAAVTKSYNASGTERVRRGTGLTKAAGLVACMQLDTRLLEVRWERHGVGEGGEGGRLENGEIAVGDRGGGCGADGGP